MLDREVGFCVMVQGLHVLALLGGDF